MPALGVDTVSAVVTALVASGSEVGKTGGDAGSIPGAYHLIGGSDSVGPDDADALSGGYHFPSDATHQPASSVGCLGLGGRGCSNGLAPVLTRSLVRNHGHAPPDEVGGSGELERTESRASAAPQWPSGGSVFARARRGARTIRSGSLKMTTTTTEITSIAALQSPHPLARGIHRIARPSGVAEICTCGPEPKPSQSYRGAGAE